MKMKKEICGLLVISLLGLLAGCGQEKTTVVIEDAPVTLRVVTMFGGTDPSAQVYEQIKEEYKETHPNVVIEDESRTADEEWKSAVAADFCAGNEPDVLQFLPMQRRTS